jgi:hypothetical protein
VLFLVYLRTVRRGRIVTSGRKQADNMLTSQIDKKMIKTPLLTPPSPKE